MGVADNRSYKNEYHFTDDSRPTSEQHPSIEKNPKVNTSIKENPYRSNVEIEGGEIVLQPDLSALFKAKGKRHSQGGMDVLLKPDSFVFSDYKELEIDEDEAEDFELKEGGTPAKTLKKNIDIKHYNSLIQNIDNPYKDDLAKKSSARMLEKYIKMLGNIAYLQENKKGFPQGLPDFSIGTAPMENEELEDQMDENKQYMKAGGTIKNPYRMQSGGFKRVNNADGSYTIYRPNGDYATYYSNGRVKIQNKGEDFFMMNTADLNSEIKDVVNIANGIQEITKGDGSKVYVYSNGRYMTVNAEGKKAMGTLTDGYFSNPDSDQITYSKYGDKGWFDDENFLKNNKSTPTSPTTQPVAPTSQPIPTRNPSPSSVFDNDWMTVLTGNKNAVLSKEAAADLAQKILSPQHRRKSGVYGDSDWDVEDFKRRHSWYIETNPDFNPANPEDVKDFQTKYNQKSMELFGRQYFTGKGFRGIDSKFGEYTYNAPGLIMSPSNTKGKNVSNFDFSVKPKITGKVTDPTIQEQDYTPQGVKRADWQFTPWQKLSQAYNWGQYAGVQRYMPFRSRYNATYVDPALVNPEQAIGDMKGMTNQQLASLSTLSPILRNAQAAGSFGQLLGQIGSVRSQYDNQNQAILNQTRQYNNQVKNNESLVNMGNDQQYYTQAVEARKNFDNMRTFTANQAMNNVLRDVETNQKLAYNLLTQNNPAYNFDWRTGNFTRTNKSILDVQNSGKNDDLENFVGEIIKDWDKMDTDQRLNFLKILTAKGFTPSGNTSNPFAGMNLPAKKGGKIKNPYK